MRLATIYTESGTAAVRVDGDESIIIDGYSDLSELLRKPNWSALAAAATGDRAEFAAATLAPVVPRPEKIICVGLNYRKHILEMGRELPEHPTLFAKFASALVGCGEPIRLPKYSDKVDWEAELAVIIGKPLNDISAWEAIDGIAGYTILNDVTARDWQYRTTQWLQGKTFDASTPLGPVMVTSDEFAGTVGKISCEVNGDLVQEADIGDLVFGPSHLVSYISKIFTLMPGDVIATGTPGGVGHARVPARYLGVGDTVVTTIDGIGRCRNVCRKNSRS